MDELIDDDAAAGGGGGVDDGFIQMTHVPPTMHTT